MSVGLTVAANLGKLVPYLDLAYESEDTTAPQYKAEAGTDGTAADLAASNASSSVKLGVGLNFNLSSQISGGIRGGWVTGRDDWEESYIGANLRVGF